MGDKERTRSRGATTTYRAQFFFRRENPHCKRFGEKWQLFKIGYCTFNAEKRETPILIHFGIQSDSERCFLIRLAWHFHPCEGPGWYAISSCSAAGCIRLESAGPNEDLRGPDFEYKPTKEVSERISKNVWHFQASSHFPRPPYKTASCPPARDSHALEWKDVGRWEIHYWAVLQHVDMFSKVRKPQTKIWFF